MSSLFSLFADNLLPVFLAAGAGFALASFTVLDSRSISRITFYIFSPALVFTRLTANERGDGAIARVLCFAVSLMRLLALLACLAARIFRLSRKLTVAVMLGALLPNAGNFGLAVNLFAFGEPGLAQASLFFIASSVMANTFGVYLASLGKSDYRSALLGLLKIPTIYAVVLAFLFLRFGWRLPLPVARATSVLGDAAIPTMLVLLGMLLRRAEWRGKFSGLLVANTMRLVASPLVAILLAASFGLSGSARQAGILEASMPSAVMTTVLTSEFEVEPAFMTAVVFTTTLLSPLTLTPILAYLGG